MRAVALLPGIDSDTLRSVCVAPYQAFRSATFSPACVAAGSVATAAAISQTSR